MKNREIYDTALCLLAEPDGALRLEDYASRAPYILSGFFYENSPLDDKYRELMGQGARTTVISVPSELDSDFPLSERFVSATANYLAAMLVCDSDSELSDRLFQIQTASLGKILSEISHTGEQNGGNSDTSTPDADEAVCGESHSIVNVYGNIT